jgi:ligand-binding sensor domain-containing protein
VPGEKDLTRRWTVFRKQDGLADNETTAIAVDDEYVWVGTRYWGISRYEKALNRWRTRPFTPLDGLGANRINGLIVDGKQVWAATDDGLSVYDRYTELWSNFDAKQGLSAKQVTCLASDGKGIWAGTYGGGAQLFRQGYDEVQVYGTADGLADETVFSVGADGSSVWVGTFGGVSRNVKGEAIPWKNYNKSSHKLIDNAVTAIGSTVTDLARNGRGGDLAL